MYSNKFWKGFPKVSLPQWVVKNPTWRLANDEVHVLSDREWLVLATLFIKSNFGFKYRKSLALEYEVKFKQKELVKATGLGKGHVSECLATLQSLGVIQRLAKSYWSLEPAIMNGFSDGKYRDVLVPKELFGLVPVGDARISEIRFWCAVHFYALVNKRSQVRIPQSALCDALGRQDKATGRISTSTEASKLVDAERIPKKSTVYDPRPLREVLELTASGEVRLKGAGSQLTDRECRILANRGGSEVVYDVAWIIANAMASNPPLDPDGSDRLQATNLIS